MEKEIYFERCIDFLTKMIEKYGNELEIVESIEIQTEDMKDMNDTAIYTCDH